MSSLLPRAAPWLHVVTTDEVVEDADFLRRAAAVLQTLGPAGVLHLRTRTLDGAGYVALARRVLDVSRSAGSLLVISARVDVALAAGADGVQLGRGALLATDVRGIAPALGIGVSLHPSDPPEAAMAADWTVFGPVFPTRSHPGARGTGLGAVESAAQQSTCPLIAIGGITPDHLDAVLAAGASGIAVVSGVWHERDPESGVNRYLSAYAQRNDWRGDRHHCERERASDIERHDPR